jgi:ABC-type multidrug transport system ATPase subunit
MHITLENTGKKYMHKWIFRNLHLEFSSPQHFGLLGNNGSGKSTLLKIISGLLSPSEGKVKWESDGKDISESVFRFIGIASPHQELIEEFTLMESFLFHQKFKPFLKGHNPDSLIRLSGLSNSQDKAIKYYSSGMKQRVKLLLALMSNVPLILLDEPCTNLDQNSIDWYKALINNYSGNRLLIIASNDKETECFSCNSFWSL